jgi:copper(I)-binding protein
VVSSGDLLGMNSRVVAVVAALALAGCGSDQVAQSDTGAGETVQTTAAPADGVRIEHAWARTSAAGQTTGAIYFDLTSSIDDRLVGATVPASVAADAQIHEVVPADMGSDDTMDDMGDDMGDDDMGDMGSDDTMDDAGHMGTDAGTGDMGDMGDDDMGDMGAMVMQQVQGGLALAAGVTVSFEPGSYHVMMLDLVAPLVVGDQIELTLDFENAGSQTITVPVAETAP